MLQRIIDWFSRVGEWLASLFSAAWEFLSDLVLMLFSSFLTSVVVLFEAIPVPAWADGLSLNWVPASMAYFLEPFNIPLAVTCITGAYLTRFVIRRLPVVG